MLILAGSKKKDLKNYPDNVPDEMLNEGWAQKIHGQSLKHLNSRGGMSVCEILLNIDMKELDWSPGAFSETQEKIDRLNGLMEKFSHPTNKQ
jgi:hypothetical protein